MVGLPGSFPTTSIPSEHYQCVWAYCKFSAEGTGGFRRLEDRNVPVRKVRVGMADGLAASLRHARTRRRFAGHGRRAPERILLLHRRRFLLHGVRFWRRLSKIGLHAARRLLAPPIIRTANNAL